MKRTTSFHLEEDIIEEIEAYKDKHDLSSRNAALERMLLERRNILALTGIFNKGYEEVKEEKINKEDNSKDTLKKSIENSFLDMPD